MQIYTKNSNHVKSGQVQWIFDNPLFNKLLKGAMRGLEFVAISTFDMKLALITRMFRDWMEKKEKEWEEQQEKLKKEKERMNLY